MKLTNPEKKQLKSLAHNLKPVVMVGKNGLSENLVESVDNALGIHELIKMKFIDQKDGKKELSRELADRTNSNLVDIIGNVAILFRENAQPEKRKIFLT